MQPPTGFPGDSLWERIRLAGMAIAEAADVRAQGILDPAGVHAVRVACKQSRALWQLFELTLGAQRIAGPDRALRDAARALAGRREDAVLVKTVRRLARGCGKRADRLLLLEFEARLASGVEFGEPDEGVRTRVGAVMQAQRSELATLPSLFGAEELAWGLGRSIDRARKAGRRALQARDAEEVLAAWHRCRRWVKYECYQLDVCLPQPGRRLGRRRAALERLGVLLGRYNDLADLDRHLEHRFMAPSGHTDVPPMPPGVLRELDAGRRLRRLVVRDRARLSRRIERAFRRLYGSGQQSRVRCRLADRMAAADLGVRV